MALPIILALLFSMQCTYYFIDLVENVGHEIVLCKHWIIILQLGIQIKAADICIVDFE
jgi:hypothetical protein